MQYTGNGDDVTHWRVGEYNALPHCICTCMLYTTSRYCTTKNCSI